MKKIARILLLSIIVLTAAVITITACGGSRSSGAPGALRAFVFNSNPLGFHVTSGFGPSRASIAPFTVNAQTTTPGGGNFPGFCDNSFSSTVSRAHTVVYGLGRWTSGSCQDGLIQFSDVGVSIPQTGQIGNLTVDAVSLNGSSGADDGIIGLSSSASGQLQVIVIHADGSQTSTFLTCSFGVTTPAQKVHCEDKALAHHVDTVSGDQIVALFWVNPGDSYHAIRVNIEFATPTF